MCGGGRETHDIEEAKKLDVLGSRIAVYEKQMETARWHGALQAKFEIETFGYTLYKLLDPATVAL